MTQKQDMEIDLVQRLLEALSIPEFNLKPGDRPDVLAKINGRCIGIEVTQFHGDEEQNSNRGSIQRRNEEQISRQANGRAYAMWGTLNPLPALIARIKDKIERAQSYRNQGFNELWLLVAASVPQLGAVCSTFMVLNALNLNDLNGATDTILRNSPFSRVYLHSLLGYTLHEWSSDKEWQVLQAPTKESQGSELWFKKILRDPEWLHDPVGKGHAEAIKALEELRAMKQN